MTKKIHILWSGDVIAANADEIGNHTEAELKTTPPGMQVVIDLARVTFVDSTGIGLMLRFKKSLKRRNIDLQFVNPGPAVRDVFRHTRLEEYLLGEV